MLIHGADIVLSFLGQTSHLILINNIFITSVTLTTKKKKQLRHRQVRSLAQSYTARPKVAQLEFCTRESQGGPEEGP